MWYLGGYHNSSSHYQHTRTDEAEFANKSILL